MSRSHTLKRQAIATGLYPFLDEGQLLDAIAHWQQHYADQPSFSLQRFATEICLQYGLQSRRQQIHLSLVQAMSLPERLLRPLPANDNQAPAHSHTTSDALQALLLALRQNLPASDAEQLWLSLHRYPAPGKQRLLLERWLDQPGQPLPTIPDAVLQGCLNHGYVRLCELYGPVKADAQLKLAVEQVHRQQPGLQGPLRQLL